MLIRLESIISTIASRIRRTGRARAGAGGAVRVGGAWEAGRGVAEAVRAGGAGLAGGRGAFDEELAGCTAHSNTSGYPSYNIGVWLGRDT